MVMVVDRGGGGVLFYDDEDTMQEDYWERSLLGNAVAVAASNILFFISFFGTHLDAAQRPLTSTH